MIRTQPIREDRGPFGRQPFTLGGLARGQGSQNTGTNPLGTINPPGVGVGSSLTGAAPGMAPITRSPFEGPRTHTQAAPGAITDGRTSGLYVGRSGEGTGGGNRTYPRMQGGGYQQTPALDPAMLSMFASGDDATRQAMMADLPLAMVQQLAGAYGAQSGMDMNAVINRWGNGTGSAAGTAYTPGMFGAGTSRSANNWGMGTAYTPGTNQIGGTAGGAQGGAAPVGSGVGGQPGMGSPGYGVNVADYLDPSMRFQMGEGLRALENSAAARGSLGSGGTLRDILRYSQGLASTDYGNAFNRASNVRDFTYGVDRDDRNFDYGVARDDRNFDYARLRDLAGMGLSATGSAATGSNVLSGLIASLINNQGQIQGAGNIGSSNAINRSISDILGQLTMQQLLGQFGAGRAGA